VQGKENYFIFALFIHLGCFHSKIINLLHLNLYISEASQKRPDVLQDEESVLQKKMKSSKTMLFFTPTKQWRHKSDTAVDHFKPGYTAVHPLIFSNDVMGSFIDV